MVFMAKALLIAPCKQSSPRWAAKRMGDVAVRTTHPITGQCIYVRRLIIRAAIEADIAIAEVICQNDDDVGMVRRLLRSKRAKKGTKREENSKREVVEQRESKLAGYFV